MQSTHENPGFNIESCEFEALEKALMLCVNPVVLANIFLQAPDGELLFVFTQPFSRTGKVRQDEIRPGCNDNGNSSFDDEQPSPKLVSVAYTFRIRKEQ